MTFSWAPTTGISNATSLTPIITPTSTNTYKLTGNYNGCIPIKDSFKITVLPLPVLVTNPTPPLCNNQSNGSIVASSTSSTLPLSFSINPGSNTFNSSPALFANLASNVYTVSITDGNGCTKTSSVNVTNPTALVWNTTTTVPIPCNSGNIGQISAAVAGGTGSKTYTLSPGNISNSTGNFTGLAAGNYTVVAKDANNCTISTVLIVNQVTGLNWLSINKLNVLCSGSNTGSINVLATGSSSTITYQITPGSTSNTTGAFTGLVSNTYTVLASDASGCTVSTTIFISQPASPITASISSTTDLICESNATGIINANAVGGVNPYTFTINPGATQNTSGTFTGLTYGTYTITATGANGCTSTTLATLTSPPPLIITNLNITYPNCVPGNNGSVTISATGGIGPLEYRITNFVYQSSNVLAPFGPGSYTAQVKDANGCITSQSMFIPNPSAVAFTKTVVQPTCTTNTGSIQITPTAGVAPFTFTLDPGPVTNNTGTFNNLVPNTYTIVTTDASGCTKSTVITIIQPLLTWNSLSVTNIPCNGVGTGTISTSASGGVNPITYSITPGAATNTTGVFSGLSTGTYTITASDAGGCTNTTVGNIIILPAFSYGSPTLTQIACHNQSNGAITVNPVGVSGTINYTLNPGNINNTTGSFSNLSAGSYTISGVDALGCFAGTVITLSNPSQLIISSVNFSPSNCAPNNNGFITVNASGGTGTKVFKLNAGAYQSSNSFTNLSNANYTITVKDANGCTVTSTLAIVNSNIPFFSSLTSSQVNCSGGLATLTAVVTGGIAPIDYTITPGLVTNTTGIFSGLAPKVFILLQQQMPIIVV
ncbi:MAG: hypothetical protein R2831_12960 [Chitinophagaceae bacterium]